MASAGLDCSDIYILITDRSYKTLISHVMPAHDVMCTTSWHNCNPQQTLNVFHRSKVRRRVCSVIFWAISSVVQNYSSSSIQGPSPTPNPRPVETTPPSSCLDPSATVTSTPIVLKASGVDNHSSTKTYQRDANICLTREMENRFRRLMLPGEFLNKYLPLDDPKLVCPESNWPEIHTGLKEVGMYLLFVSITLRSCQPAHTKM